MRDYTPKIAKKDLIHGEYYRGRCRNASVARWNAETQTFHHYRSKFGFTFIEEIKHPEDDQHFDVFVVESKIEPDDDFWINHRAITFKGETDASNPSA